MRLGRSDLALVGVLALATRLFAAWAIPHGAGSGDPNCAPDESSHLEVVRILATGRTPAWPAVHTPYPAYVPFCYVPQAVSLATLSSLGLDRPALYRFPPRQSVAQGFPLARLGSVLAGSAAVLMFAAAAATWFGSRLAGVFAGLGATFFPQLVFVSAYVNGDVVTVASFCALAWAVARWVRAGEGDTGLRRLAVATSAVVLSKPYGFAFLPATALWVGSAAVAGCVSRRAAGRAAGVFALLVAPVLAWNAWRNYGDVLGTRTMKEFIAENPGAWKVASQYPEPLRGFVLMTSKSAFGVFGNNSVSLPTAFYASAALLLAVGLSSALVSLRTAAPFARRSALWLASGVALNVALAVQMSWFVNYQPQGRYVLPAALSLLGVTLLAPAAVLRDRLRWSFSALAVAFLAASLFVSARLMILRPCG